MGYSDPYGAIGSVEDADRLRINAAYNPNTGSYAGYGGGAGAYGNQRALYEQFQGMFDKANTANESRYQDIKSRYENRRARTLADLQGSGDQERKDLETQYAGLGSKIGQNLVNRGLSGSSIAPTMQMGLQREQADAIGRLNDRLRTQRIGYDTGLDADTLQFMERKNEVGPDLGMLAQLAQGLGGHGGGYGAYDNYGVGGGLAGNRTTQRLNERFGGQLQGNAMNEGPQWSPFGLPYPNSTGGGLQVTPNGQPKQFP